MRRTDRKPLIRWIVLLALSCFAVGLSGCGCTAKPANRPSLATDSRKPDNEPGDSSSATGSGSKSDELKLTAGGKPPAKSDLLLLYYPDDPDTLNLVTSSDNIGDELHEYVYEFLAKRNFADPEKWEPALAESWEFDADTLTFTFQLRKGVYWHPMKFPSGKDLPRTEFTSADVKFTFDCILNEGIDAAALRSYYSKRDAKESEEKARIKITIVDKYKVKIQWLEPYFLAKEFTLGGTRIMPRHVYSVDANGEPISLDFRNSKEFAEALNSHWANTRMCGTGPLIFEEWKKEDRTSMVRNEDYWGKPFYFDKVLFRYISNPQTAVQQVLQGEQDWALFPEKDQYVQTLEHANVQSGKVKLAAFDYPGYRYMGFNVKRDLFADKRVRSAISHAVPVDEIIEKIYFGLAKRLSGPFLPGSTSNDESIPFIAYDLDKAKRLLDEAGWKDTDENGIRDKQVAGKNVEATFDLMIYGESPQYQRIAEIVKENCRRIGIEVKITPTQWALMLQNLRKKEFDATILGWVMEYKSDPYQVWHGSQADLPESSNHCGYRNPELDKLIDELRVTLDEDKQRALFHKIHRVIYDDQPCTFLFMDKRTTGYDARLENIAFYKIRPGYDVREWSSSRPRNLAQ